MELMTRAVRQSGMMSPRQVRGTVLAVLLCSALAGCGSVTASSAAGPGATSSPPAASSAAAAASSAPATAATGCASVNQATSVTVHRTMHLVEPTRMGALSKTQNNAALVRALFGQFCAAVAHAAAAKVRTDMAAVLEVPASMMAQPKSQSGNAGPNKLR